MGEALKSNIYRWSERGDLLAVPGLEGHTSLATVATGGGAEG